jgi:hypothetical protein
LFSFSIQISRRDDYADSAATTCDAVGYACMLQGSRVEVAVNTTEPYQHCLTVQQPSSSSSEAAAAASVVVQGLTFSHYSKSVADNYAVFVQVREAAAVAAAAKQQ